MAFDIFSMPQGPQISVSLFADVANQSATTGTNIGRAVPSPVSAAIQGVQQGIKFGQEVVENAQQQEIRQHQIDRLPITDQIQDAQLRAAQLNQQITELNLQTKLATQESDLTAAKLNSETALVEARQKRDDVATFESIKLDLNNPDPNVRKRILEVPNYSDYLARNPDRAEGVISNLQRRGDLTNDEAIKAYGIVDFYRAQSLENEKLKAQKAVNDALVKNLDKDLEVLSDPTVRSVVQGLSAADIANKDKVQIYVKGTKQYDEKTKILTPKAADLPVAPGEDNKYEVFINDKLAPLELDKTQATKLQALQDSVNRAASGQSAVQEFLNRTRASDQTTGAAGTTATARPTAPPVTFESLVQSATKAGIPQEQATEILGEAKKAGTQANLAQRLLTKLLPPSLQHNPVIYSSIGNIDEPSDVRDIRGVLESSSKTLANGTLQGLNSGSTVERDQIRLWAKANGVPLTYSGLKNYYEDRARTVLNEGYESAYQMGIEETQQKTSAAAAKDATKARAEELLVGKTPEEAVELGRQTEAAAIKQDIAFSQSTANDLGARVDNVAAFYNLNPRQKADIGTRVKNVSLNPVLSDKPVYVKAVSAVESAGVNGAISETNVVGPMQVTQAAATDVSNALGVRLDKNDPEQNALIGQLYLEDLINQFKGNTLLAYAAYNAGAGTIKHAKKLAGGSEDWQEVKKHLIPAINKYYKPKDRVRKLQEVYNYPEKVSLYEKIFV